MPESANSFCASLDKLDTSSFTSDSDRVLAKNAALRLVARLETPWEATLDAVWSKPALSACLKIGVDIELFKKWASTGATTRTGAQLAELTGVDPVVLRRFLRHMSAMRALHETSEDLYEMTPFTESLGENGHSNCFSYWVDVNAPGFTNLPQFMANTNYKDTQNPADCNWQMAKNTDLDIFQWLAANPKAGVDFNYVMTAYSASKPSLGEIYPAERLLEGWNKQAPLLIDIGGSHGHDIEKFRTQHKNLPSGSLVLQDLAGPIGEAKVQEPIQAQVHDFFQPQPVQGARAYYLHCVLHDWPDAKASEILQNIAKAMQTGYSKVLLHESVITAVHPHPQTTASDLTMMMTMSAVERTEGMWKDLLASAGLKMVKVWSTPAAIESIIEAELA